MPKRKRPEQDEDTSSDIDNDNSSQSEELSEVTKESLTLEAYNQVNHDLPIKAAFFYRKDELDKLVSSKFDAIVEQQEEYIKNFKERMTNFLNSKNQNIPQRELDEFVSQEKDICNHLPINGVIGNFIQQILVKNSSLLEKKPISVEQISSTLYEILEKDVQDEDDSLDTRNTSEATISAYEEYFQEQYDTLIKYGMVYTLPQGKHEWSYNASWMLSHFNKGTDIFIIKSAIDDTGKLRGETSDSTGDFGSGFFREIAICYKLGYRCEKQEVDQIIFRHPNPSQLQQITLNDILDISRNQESLKLIEKFYDQAAQDYRALTNLTTLSSISPSDRLLAIAEKIEPHPQPSFSSTSSHTQEEKEELGTDNF